MNQNPENPFYAAMLSDYSDSLPRLIFADWLEERGKLERSMQLCMIHGFSRSVGGDSGDSGIGIGIGIGVGVGVGVGGGVGVGVGVGVGITLISGNFVMSNGFYLVYFPTGYYPLVMVGYVAIDGCDLVLHGSKVVANSGIGAEWAKLADTKPDKARFHAAAKHEVRIPRQCIVHKLNMDVWASYIPEAVKYATSVNGDE